MSVRTFALVWGILFLVAGVAGFVPGLWHAPEAHYPDMALNSFYGSILGLFPVNLLHNAVHLLFGVWGVLAARSAGSARTFAQVVAVAYGALVVIGLIPGLNTLFGLVPLFGNDVWLHALLAIPAAYFGFVHREAGRVEHVRS